MDELWKTSCVPCTTPLFMAIVWRCGHAVCTCCTRTLILRNEARCPKCRYEPPRVADLWGCAPSVLIRDMVRDALSAEEIDRVAGEFSRRYELMYDTLGAWAFSLLSAVPYKCLPHHVFLGCISEAYGSDRDVSSKIYNTLVGGGHLHVFGAPLDVPENALSLVYHTGHAEDVLRNTLKYITSHQPTPHPSCFIAWLKEADTWQSSDPDTKTLTSLIPATTEPLSDLGVQMNFTRSKVLSGHCGTCHGGCTFAGAPSAQSKRTPCASACPTRCFHGEHTHVQAAATRPG